MSKQDVVDYVMHTPYNANEAVLRTLLNGLSSSGDNQENNYEEIYIVPPQLINPNENESLIVNNVDVSTLENNELVIMKTYTENDDISINFANYDEEGVFYFGSEKVTDIMGYDSVDKCWMLNIPNATESFALAITKISIDDVKQLISDSLPPLPNIPVPELDPSDK